MQQLCVFHSPLTAPKVLGMLAMAEIEHAFSRGENLSDTYHILRRGSDEYVLFAATGAAR